MGKKAHGSKHHIIPISRRGQRNPENEKEINPEIHNAWHVLWGNLLAEEVICLIEELWSDNNGVIREKYLSGEEIAKKRKVADKRMSAWKTIFGDTRSAKEAVKIIKETFTKRT